MNDSEAQAALLTLSDPIAWEVPDWAQSGNCWEGEFSDSAGRTFSFDIEPARIPDRDLAVWDEKGTRFDWSLGVKVRTPWALATATPGSRLAWVAGTEEWEVPCQTPDEAKAICLRLVVTGEFTEVDGRDAQRYTLRWLPWRHLYDRGGLAGEETATVKRCGKSTGCYRISRFDGNPTKEQIEALAETLDAFDPVADEAIPTARLYDRQGNLWRLRALYMVEMRDRERRERLHGALSDHHLRKPSHSPYRYDTEADAKAACERYHATGKWD